MIDERYSGVPEAASFPRVIISSFMRFIRARARARKIILYRRIKRILRYAYNARLAAEKF